MNNITRKQDNNEWNFRFSSLLFFFCYYLPFNVQVKKNEEEDNIPEYYVAGHTPAYCKIIRQKSVCKKIHQKFLTNSY